MNSKQLTLLAAGSFLAASPVLADWTDYFFIGSPNQGGQGQIIGWTPAMGPVSLDKAYPPLLGAQAGAPNTPWVFSNTGLAGSQAEMTRSPSSVTDFATGFTLTTKQGGLAQIQIEAPTFAPAHGDNWNDYYCQLPGQYYNFSWNFDVKPGSSAWWVDAYGRHDITQFPIGTGQFYADQYTGGADQEQVYGFFLSVTGNLPNTLQIQGWECVPEPSSVAMGLITLVGGAVLGYRRCRKP